MTTYQELTVERDRFLDMVGECFPKDHPKTWKKYRRAIEARLTCAFTGIGWYQLKDMSLGNPFSLLNGEQQIELSKWIGKIAKASLQFDWRWQEIENAINSVCWQMKDDRNDEPLNLEQLSVLIEEEEKKTSGEAKEPAQEDKKESNKRELPPVGTVCCFWYEHGTRFHHVEVVPDPNNNTQRVLMSLSGKAAGAYSKFPTVLTTFVREKKEADGNGWLQIKYDPNHIGTGEISAYAKAIIEKGAAYLASLSDVETLRLRDVEFPTPVFEGYEFTKSIGVARTFSSRKKEEPKETKSAETEAVDDSAKPEINVTVTSRMVPEGAGSGLVEVKSGTGSCAEEAFKKVRELLDQTRDGLYLEYKSNTITLEQFGAELAKIEKVIAAMKS